MIYVSDQMEDVWSVKFKLVAKLRKAAELKSFMLLFRSEPAFSIYKHLSNDTRKKNKHIKKS